VSGKSKIIFENEMDENKTSAKLKLQEKGERQKKFKHLRIKNPTLKKSGILIIHIPKTTKKQNSSQPQTNSKQ
jgi:hypothetical protein